MEPSLQTAEPRPGVLAQPAAAVRTRHRNPRGQGARLTEDIVSAALALIERTGSAEAVTLRAVAREVGIAAPSIYAHFPDRDAVLMAVVVRVFDELTQAIEQGKKSVGQDPPAAWSQAARRTWPSGSSTPPATACCSPRSGRTRQTTASRSRSGLTAGRCPNSGPSHSRSSSRPSRNCVTAGVSASSDVVADATAVWVALHGTVSLRTALARFPWPDPAAFVRQLVLSLAQVTA